ncbi:unnamed protein product [Cyclocybe aegerita]|uniref:Uncharacterized protein n=1 Tax=Cyclocybe aegerita TaxID=1973307 RepID=A0A8S0X1N8_CYCAE|nr:unnamed protein product [Cyclocybe aegerita]
MGVDDDSAPPNVDVKEEATQAVRTRWRPLIEIVPLEIWRECWMYANARGHRTLTSVCRLFRDICLPFVFKELSYSPAIGQALADTNDNTSARKGWVYDMKARAKRMTELAGSQQHASMVRECKLYAFFGTRRRKAIKRSNPVKSAYNAFVEAFVSALPRFTNLTRVDITADLDIDNRILSALAFIPKIDSVCLSGTFARGESIDPLIKPRILEVYQEDGIEYSDPPSNVRRVVSVQRLEELHLHSYILAPRIMYALTPQGNCSRLTVLEIDFVTGHAAVLSAFLGVCPQLRTLLINDHYDFDPQPAFFEFTISPTTIPLLEAFFGPVFLASLIIPGRPVRKIALDLFQWDKTLDAVVTTLERLSRSTGPVRELKLPAVVCYPDVPTTIARLFPDLTSLKFRVDDAEHEHDVNCAPEERTLVDDERRLDFVVHRHHCPFSYEGLLCQIASLQVSLPRGLERLRLNQFDMTLRDNNRMFGQCLSGAVATVVATLLGATYPLKELWIGKEHPDVTFQRQEYRGEWKVVLRRRDHWHPSYDGDWD